MALLKRCCCLTTPQRLIPPSLLKNTIIIEMPFTDLCKSSFFVFNLIHFLSLFLSQIKIRMRKISKWKNGNAKALCHGKCHQDLLHTAEQRKALFSSYIYFLLFNFHSFIKKKKIILPFFAWFVNSWKMGKKKLCNAKI